MKFILFITLLFSSPLFAQIINMKIGAGYEKRDGDSIEIYSPDLKKMEIDCSSPLGVLEKIQSRIHTTAVTTNVFAIETSKSCLILMSYSIGDGPSISLGQLRIPFTGNINEIIFNGTPLVLEDGYTYTPTIGISPL